MLKSWDGEPTGTYTEFSDLPGDGHWHFGGLNQLKGVSAVLVLLFKAASAWERHTGIRPSIPIASGTPTVFRTITHDGILEWRGSNTRLCALWTSISNLVTFETRNNVATGGLEFTSWNFASRKWHTISATRATIDAPEPHSPASAWPHGSELGMGHFSWSRARLWLRQIRVCRPQLSAHWACYVWLRFRLGSGPGIPNGHVSDNYVRRDVRRVPQRMRTA